MSFEICVVTCYINAGSANKDSVRMDPTNVHNHHEYM